VTDRYAAFPRLRVERAEPAILRILLDATGLNAVTAEMHRDLAEIWREVDRDPDTRVAVIEGVGRAFSAGGSFDLVHEDEVHDRALEIARTLATGAQSAIRWTKHVLNHWYRTMTPVFDASLAYEFYGFGGPDAVEGLAAHIDKRAPEFLGPTSE